MGFASDIYSSIEILLSGEGDLRIGLASRGVNGVASLGGAREFSIDNVVESLKNLSIGTEDVQQNDKVEVVGELAVNVSLPVGGPASLERDIFKARFRLVLGRYDDYLGEMRIWENSIWSIVGVVAAINSCE